MDRELCWQNYTPERLNLAERNLKHRALTLPFIEVNIYWPLQQQPAQGAPKFLQKMWKQQQLQEQKLPSLSFVPLPISAPSLQCLDDSPATNKLAVHPA